MHAQASVQQMLSGSGGQGSALAPDQAHPGQHGGHNGLRHAHCARQIRVHDLLEVLQRLLHQRARRLHS